MGACYAFDPEGCAHYGRKGLVHKAALLVSGLLSRWKYNTTTKRG